MLKKMLAGFLGVIVLVFFYPQLKMLELVEDLKEPEPKPKKGEKPPT